MEVERSQSTEPVVHVHVHGFVPKAVLMTLPTRATALMMLRHQSLGSQEGPGYWRDGVIRALDVVAAAHAVHDNITITKLSQIQIGFKYLLVLYNSITFDDNDELPFE